MSIDGRGKPNQAIFSPRMSEELQSGRHYDWSGPFQFHHERFPVDQIHRIDFSIEQEFPDPTLADACVRVLTSDGKTGTCAHLSVFHDPEQLARDLRQLLGRDGIPAILNGGLETSWPSVALRDRLYGALIQQGFIVSLMLPFSDTLGSYTRAAVLTRDRVRTIRVPYGKSPLPEELTLFFPS